ncbi:hypothetical protein AAFC00_001013 [Neodothiora populina]|uniref:PNPLA domain-containing protein n=1 Tax=Neodothiora populina TaxID=2781224 RepID=A0ABR3PMH7_9PEZI
MYGTSTGGLIAVMLGRLRMRIEECLQAYQMVGDRLFGHRRSVIPMATKYKHEPLEKAVQEIVIHNRNVINAHLLRSYPHFYDDAITPNWLTRYNEGADPLTIWQTTRATSAAPFYFELLAAEINGEMRNFKDGGIRENNPSSAAWNEFHSLYAAKKKEDPAVLLSIGTGLSDQSQDGFATAWPGPLGNFPIIRKIFEGLEKFSIVPSLLVKFTDSEKTHQTMRNYAKGEHKYYKRLNVDTGLEKMPLDHWVKGLWKPLKSLGISQLQETDQVEAKVEPGGVSLTKMEQATFAYLNRDFDAAFDSYAAPKDMMDQTAQKLVRLRRARAKAGGPRWETFIGKHLSKEMESDGGSTTTVKDR